MKLLKNLLAAFQPSDTLVVETDEGTYLQRGGKLTLLRPRFKPTDHEAHKRRMQELRWLYQTGQLQAHLDGLNEDQEVDND